MSTSASGTRLPEAQATRSTAPDRDGDEAMNDLEEDTSAGEDEEEAEEHREDPRGKQPVRGPALRTSQKPIPRPAPAQRFAAYDGELRLQESLKVALPDKYHGDRKELETFLLQLGMYYRFNPDKFATTDAMSLWASSYLRGEALKWIEPFLSDYFENSINPGKMMATTMVIFGSFEGFRREIRRVFGDIDVVRTAERKLLALRQTGSAINYATEFRKYGNQTDWNTAALLSHYTLGLRNSIKLELSRRDPIDNMNDLIEETIRIDNREYEFQREVRFSSNHRPRFYKPNEKRSRNQGRQISRSQDYGDPMELDAMSSRNNLSQDERNRRREQRLCFECGFPGHQARDCRKKSQGTKPKKSKWKGKKQLKTMVGKDGGQAVPRHQLSMMSSQRTPQELDHAMLSWTACYKDSCLVHKSDKDGAGWYPKKPSKKATKRDSPPQQGEVWFLEKISDYGTRSWRQKEFAGLPGNNGLWNDARNVQGQPIVGRYYKLELEVGSIRIWRETRTQRGFKEFYQLEPPSERETWEVIHQYGHKDQRMTLLQDLNLPQRVVIQVFRHEIPTEYIDIPIGRVLRVRTGTHMSTVWEDVIDTQKRFFGFMKGSGPKVIDRNKKRANQE
jgi:hypothetical protein